MTRPRVLVLPGSIRRDGLHRRLAVALSPMLDESGLDALMVDLTDLPMPIYHGDLEADSGVPAAAHELADLIASAAGLIVLSPEYNGGPSALLKNAIDWSTRVDRAVFHHLLVGLGATSPGRSGGGHGLGQLRGIFAHMGVEVVADDLSIPRGFEAFDGEGGASSFARDQDRVAAAAFVERYAAALAARLGEPGAAAGG